MNTPTKVYTVIAEKDKFKCIDTSNGMTVNIFTFNGEIVSGPVVTGDRMTVVVKSGSGLIGRVFSLPNFSIVSTFDVN